MSINFLDVELQFNDEERGESQERYTIRVIGVRDSKTTGYPVISANTQRRFFFPSFSIKSAPAAHNRTAIVALSLVGNLREPRRMTRVR